MSGIEDPELRIDLMSQVGVFPAASAGALAPPRRSGRARIPGSRCYRLAVFDELPRTGLPEQFDSWGEYERHSTGADQGRPDRGRQQAVVGRAAQRALPDAGAARHRCLHAGSRIRSCVAAIYRCLLRMLWRLRRSQPALAPLCRDADQREPLAGAALRHRRGAGRFRQGRDRALRRICWRRSWN